MRNKNIQLTGAPAVVMQRVVQWLRNAALRLRGRKTCPNCNGAGEVYMHVWGSGMGMVICSQCVGDGHIKKSH